MEMFIRRLKAAGFYEVNRKWGVRLARKGVHGSIYFNRDTVSCTGRKTYCYALKRVPGSYPGPLKGHYPTWPAQHIEAVVEKLEELAGCLS